MVNEEPIDAEVTQEEIVEPVQVKKGLSKLDWIIICVVAIAVMIFILVKMSG